MGLACGLLCPEGLHTKQRDSMRLRQMKTRQAAVHCVSSMQRACADAHSTRARQSAG
eukprot:jgi/Antlo1/1828/1155